MKINKIKIANKWVSFENYLGIGYGKLQWIKGFGEMGLILALFFKGFFPSFPVYFSGGLTLLFFVFCVLFGIIWDRLGMVKFQTEWSNKRNPTIQYIRKNIKRNKNN